MYDLKNVFKIGDNVTCIPGFHNTIIRKGRDNFGGNGYEEGVSFIISKITSQRSENPVMWSDFPLVGGVYARALKFTTPKKNTLYKIY